jgi:hypothetical protein
MKKKTLIIIGLIVLVAAAAGVLVYIFVIRKPAPPPPEVAVTPEEKARLTLTEEEIERGLTLEEKIDDIERERRLALERGEEIKPIEVEVAAVKPIVERKVSTPTLSPDRKNLFYFDPEAGEFYISELDGSNPRAITTANLRNVWDINWSAGKDKAIVAFSENEGRDKEYMLFNLRDQTTIRYDKEYQGVTLSPAGDRITYLYRDEEQNISNISVADPDTSNYKILYSYPDPDVEFTWFENDYIEFNPQTTGYKEGEVAVAGAEDGTLRVIVGEKYGLDVKYSPDGTKFVFTESELKNPRKLSLNIIDNQGMRGAKYLGIDTLVDKCAWAFDNKTVYCGVPDFYVDTLIMPNDYYNGKFISTDSFYRIDTETQRADLIAASDTFDETYDIFDPFVSEDGKVFYFTNRIDEQMHALTIPD